MMKKVSLQKMLLTCVAFSLITPDVYPANTHKFNIRKFFEEKKEWIKKNISKDDLIAIAAGIAGGAAIFGTASGAIYGFKKLFSGGTEHFPKNKNPKKKVRPKKVEKKTKSRTPFYDFCNELANAGNLPVNLQFLFLQHKRYKRFGKFREAEDVIEEYRDKDPKKIKEAEDIEESKPKNLKIEKFLADQEKKVIVVGLPGLSDGSLLAAVVNAKIMKENDSVSTLLTVLEKSIESTRQEIQDAVNASRLAKKIDESEKVDTGEKTGYKPKESAETPFGITERFYVKFERITAPKKAEAETIELSEEEKNASLSQEEVLSVACGIPVIEKNSFDKNEIVIRRFKNEGNPETFIIAGENDSYFAMRVEHFGESQENDKWIVILFAGPKAALDEDFFKRTAEVMRGKEVTPKEKASCDSSDISEKQAIRKFLCEQGCDIEAISKWKIDDQHTFNVDKKKVIAKKLENDIVALQFPVKSQKDAECGLHAYLNAKLLATFLGIKDLLKKSGEINIQEQRNILKEIRKKVYDDANKEYEEVKAKRKSQSFRLTAFLTNMIAIVKGNDDDEAKIKKVEEHLKYLQSKAEKGTSWEEKLQRLKESIGFENEDLKLKDVTKKIDTWIKKFLENIPDTDLWKGEVNKFHQCLDNTSLVAYYEMRKFLNPESHSESSSDSAQVAENSLHVTIIDKMYKNEEDLEKKVEDAKERFQSRKSHDPEVFIVNTTEKAEGNAHWFAVRFESLGKYNEKWLTGAIVFDSIQSNSINSYKNFISLLANVMTADEEFYDMEELSEEALKKLNLQNMP